LKSKHNKANGGKNCSAGSNSSKSPLSYMYFVSPQTAAVVQHIRIEQPSDSERNVLLFKKKKNHFSFKFQGRMSLLLFGLLVCHGTEVHLRHLGTEQWSTF
jgi:hypothetical protein